MPVELKEKIALFCDVPPDASCRTATRARSIKCRSTSEAEGLAEAAVRKLRLPRPAAATRRVGERSSSASCTRTAASRIALVGKYVELKDAYISINEALYHAGIFHDAAVEIGASTRRSVENEGLGVLRGVARHSRRAGLRRARRQGQAARDPVRARERRFRSSASASACSWRASSSRATCADCPKR